MRIFFAIIISVTFIGELAAQERDKHVNINVENVSLETFLGEITRLTGYEFSYNRSEINVDTLVSLKYTDTPIVSIMDSLAIFGIRYIFMKDHIVLRRIEEIEPEAGNPVKLKFTLSGHITDAVSGEALIGATIADLNTGKGAVANGYGFFSLTLPGGKYSFVISHLGYEQDKHEIDLGTDIVTNFSLNPGLNEIKEVIVTEGDSTLILDSPNISQVEMHSASFKQIPGFLGEPDVIKSLQSLPGINFFSDGSTIFHVRGGDRDQNMILIDEAPVYNPAHLLGIFSAFTPESINSINIYKGDMPASYGGRLSSVIDVKLKEGNINRLVFSGNTGPVATTLNFQGPLFNHRSSFFISARRSHLKWLIADQVPSVEKLHFSDFNIKYNFRINNHNRLYLSLYSGLDNFRNRESSSKSTGITWVNTAGNLRWNHLFGDRLFANTSFIVSNYDYNLFIDYEDNRRWNTGISLAALKSDFAFYPKPGNTYKFGVNLSTHFYSPGNYYEGIRTAPILRGVSLKQALENSVYFSFENTITRNLHVRYGARFTAWVNRGPATEYAYNDYFRPVDTLVYSKNQKYHTYTVIEPRINLTWSMGRRFSSRLALSRNSQFEYLISNSVSPFTSLETWLPAGPNIRPLSSDQVTTGFSFHDLKGRYSLDMEAFYKHISNFISYVDHAYMLFNPYVEGELRYGKARSYGIEVMGKKSSGMLQGWLSYTYTRTLIDIPALNNAREFPARYDRPHNFGIFMSYSISPRWTYSANWVWSSGNAFSTPTGYYFYNGYQVPFYEERNNDRLPPYHRLDIASEIILSRPASRSEHILRISIFNLYGRRNPFSINFNKILNDSGALVVPSDHSEPPELQPSKTYIYGIVPSISYHFRF